MRRVALALAVTIGLTFGTALSTSAIGLTQVTLSCDDGTRTTMNVDTSTLTSLIASVQAMLDYPAGLTCTLVQSPLPLAFGAFALASPGSNPFIVGGGRWEVPCSAVFLPPSPPGLVGDRVVARVPGGWYSVNAAPIETFWVNIAVNVHQRDAEFFGTLNETIPANQSCTAADTSGNPIVVEVGESHFTSKSTCLVLAPSVQPPQAFVTSQVTQTSGQQPFPAGTAGTVNVGDLVHFGFWDNQNPPGQNPTTTIPTTDMLAGPPATPEGTQASDCNPLQWDPIFHLGSFDGSKQYGNISIHQ